MKKLKLFAFITASFLLLVSASVWEGAAAGGEDLPENGLLLATNSFPVNTLVEVVNLENGKSATLIVSSPLENSGVMALLSRDAANAIGLESAGRIRMTEKDDQLDYSGFGEGQSISGDPDYTDYSLDGYDLALIPAETRPPEDWQEPDPEYIISAIPEIIEAPVIPESIVIPIIPVAPQPVITPEPQSSSITPVFSVPVIQNLERGRYYVQIGAYRKAATVESEISKVERNLPVAIMKTGNADDPIYRVLIGPLSLGESGVVLQRYKAIYNDAFLRVGN
jgi:hypothetical protein